MTTHAARATQSTELLGPAELAIASDAYQAAIALVGVDGYQEAVREALAPALWIASSAALVT